MLELKYCAKNVIGFTHVHLVHLKVAAQQADSLRLERNTSRLSTSPPA
jgi:hypothetical protein